MCIMFAALHWRVRHIFLRWSMVVRDSHAELSCEEQRPLNPMFDKLKEVVYLDDLLRACYLQLTACVIPPGNI